MGFSQEWDQVYQDGKHLSVWPWSNLISLVYRYAKPKRNMKVLEVGCGAGANIRFFQSLDVDYHAIEGSASMVEKLQKAYAGERIHIVQGDFTKKLSFFGGQKFDLIIDRAALTHNATDDIRNALKLIHEYLVNDGIFIGVDWHSVKQTASMAAAESIDAHTKVFFEGYYKGLGRVHFSDEIHLKNLLEDFQIELLEETVTTVYEPSEQGIHASWSFVATK